MQPQQSEKPFDESTALAELELLADKIQKSRLQREQTIAEFDAFVKAFRHERLSDSISATDSERRRLEDRSAVLNAATHASGASTLTPAAVVEPLPAASSVATEPATTEFVPGRWEPEDNEPLSSPAAPRAFRAPRPAYVGVVIATLAVLVVIVMLWRSSSDPAPQAPAAVAADSSSASPAAATPAPAATPPPAPAVPAGPPKALMLEFVTLRPVWARITVDGTRAFEREFPANQRLPLGADRAIAIRAGDAGAIRLIVDGRDLGVLGKDGQVFNRTFTPRPR